MSNDLSLANTYRLAFAATELMASAPAVQITIPGKQIWVVQFCPACLPSNPRPTETHTQNTKAPIRVTDSCPRMWIWSKKGLLCFTAFIYILSFFYHRTLRAGSYWDIAEGMQGHWCRAIQHAIWGWLWKVGRGKTLFHVRLCVVPKGTPQIYVSWFAGVALRSQLGVCPAHGKVWDVADASAIISALLHPNPHASRTALAAGLHYFCWQWMAFQLLISRLLHGTTGTGLGSKGAILI